MGDRPGLLRRVPILTLDQLHVASDAQERHKEPEPMECFKLFGAKPDTAFAQVAKKPIRRQRLF